MAFVTTLIPQRGQIIRVNKNLSKQLISFNITDIMNQKDNIFLQREDSVIIKSVFNLREDYYVNIQGEVRKSRLL